MDVTLKPPPAVVAWSAGAVSVAAFAVAWFLAARGHDLLDISADFGPDRFMVMWALAGAFLAARRRANPVGWLVLAVGLVAAVRGLAGEYALHVLADPAAAGIGRSVAIWSAWFVGWSLILLFPGGVLMFLLLMFPAGRLLGPRWRLVVRVAVGLSVLYLLLTWLDPGALVLGPGMPRPPNPTGLHGFIHLSRNSLFGNVAWLSGWLCLLVAAAGVVIRYRRSAGDERLQLKWFTWAVALALSLQAVLLPLAPTGPAGQFFFDAGLVAGIGLALPVAIGVAVLKYRLYAIDRIISRTVSYTLVTGLVVGVYLGCVALLTHGLPVHGNVSIALAVLVAAALFNPLRRRLQAGVDRRFNRERYDAERVVTRFAVQVRDEVDLDVLGDRMLGVVDHVLAPEHLALWLPAANPAAELTTPDRR